ncbi:hypothetical protein EUX98_g2119 [Antrodiella citrinella]|uniref:DUF6535 domain-containing protein n=1 Tax=Antrodiella citrinella TaxID=2447956 RepID=A0A4S4N1D4_9APHY|nr:hypothetical protein EUX98_g2119 [Antrodiella citrinella]
MSTSVTPIAGPSKAPDAPDGGEHWQTTGFTRFDVSTKEVQVQTEADKPTESTPHHNQDATVESDKSESHANIESLVVNVLRKMLTKAVTDESSVNGATNTQNAGAASKGSGEAQLQLVDKNQGPLRPSPIVSSPVELVQEILKILKDSTIRLKSCDFHVDFIAKYGGELDISLIFAGLFSAVSATFATALQSKLSTDPNANTQVLLMMVVRSLNSTAFAGQDLVLQAQFTGPDNSTVWVQSLLYASLGASLFAALAAMLGKEWLTHYARVGESGTIEDRCIDRQRNLKLIAMRAWQFDMVLACIPLLLQGSLLLSGISLSIYMWSQQHTIAAVIMATNATGVILYAILLSCSLMFPDCPYHIPLTDLVLGASGRSLPLLTQVDSSQARLNPEAVQQLAKMFRSCFVSPDSSPSGAFELLPSN